MHLQSLRLSTRLFLAFGVIVLLTVLSSGVALFKLRGIQQGLVDIVTVNDVKLELNHEMSEAVHIVSRVQRSLALLSDHELKGHEKAKIEAARARYDKARSELERFPASGEGKAARAAIDAARGKARPLNDEVITLALADKDDEATALLMKQAAPATQAWQDALDVNIELQKKANAAEYEAAEASYFAARNLLIGASAFSIVVAVVLTLLVVRSVVSELGGEPAAVAALAGAIADADLTRHIAVRNGDRDSVVARMARMQAALSDVVARVRGNAESVATASAQ
ncbi:MAG: MCP four helix bundle domain-containing protein, partial [Microbacteriaceae bacterium]|nr:MCP four helix bundle domain-containing protein [Microbacteriaceae bacterium]